MNDALFREFCERAPDLIQSVSPDGRFVFVNRAWRERLGYQAAEVAELRFADTVRADSRAHCERLFEQVARGRVPLRLTAVLVARDGTDIPVDGWATGSPGRAEPVATASLRPISLRERRRHQLGRLFNMSLDLLCVAGLDGYFKEINPAFERILGYPREELLSRAFIDFVHPDDRDATVARLQALAVGNPVVDFSNRYRAADGSWHWLAWRSAPAHDDGLVYAVARDITHDRQAQELIAAQAAELERSNEDLEQFASAASHDLQAPLRAISSLAGFIVEDLPDSLPEGVRQHLVLLDERVATMRELVEDLLAYARAGHLTDDLELVDTGALVARVAKLVGPPPAMRIDVGAAMPVIHTARSALEVVMRNLISNAVAHHDRDAGVVLIEASKVETAWEFRVTDDGPGIPESERQDIFRMFQHDGRRGGTGIGLALVKKIVERMGGTVRVGAATGRGSVFRFTWPDQAPATEAE